VIVREDAPGDKRLVAYIIERQRCASDDESLCAESASDLRRFLAETLPDYMIPAIYVRLNTFPLTLNGKLDWRALPPPANSGHVTHSVCPPRNDIESEVAAVWRELLKLDVVDVNHNFFEAGGHSLMAVRLLAALNERFEVQLPLRTFLLEPTIAGLAERIAQAHATDCGHAHTGPLPRAIVPIQPNGDKRPFYCAAPGGGVVFPYYNLMPYLDPARPFYGLQDPGLDEGNKPYQTVEELARHYVAEIRQFQPNGPYMVGGWSFGAYVALEMAQQLKEVGQEVTLVAIIDMPCPVAPPTGVARLLSLLGMVPGALRYGSWAARNFVPYTRDMFYVLTSGRRRDQHKSKRPGWREYMGWLWLDVMRRICSGTDVQNVLPEDAEQLSVRQPNFLPILRVNNANSKALRRYRARPYPGKLTLLRGEDRPFSQNDGDPALGWGNVAAGVDMHILPGNHVTLFRKPFIEALGHRLRAVIDQADGAVQTADNIRSA